MRAVATEAAASAKPLVIVATAGQVAEEVQRRALPGQDRRHRSAHRADHRPGRHGIASRPRPT
jgi:hypothetical protein